MKVIGKIVSYLLWLYNTINVVLFLSNYPKHIRIRLFIVMLSVIDNFLLSVFFTKLYGLLIPFAVLTMISLFAYLTDIIIPYIRDKLSLFNCYFILTISIICYTITLNLYLNTVIDEIQLITINILLGFIDSIIIAVIKSIIGNCIEKKIYPFILRDNQTNQTCSESFNRAISYVSIFMNVFVLIVYIGINNILSLNFENITNNNIHQEENIILIKLSIFINIILILTLFKTLYTEKEQLHIKL